LGNIEDLIKNKINTTSSENKKLAAKQCSLAKECLRNVETVSNPDDKKKFLLEAYDFYMEAVELNSKLVDAFHGLAFICYSLDQKKQAMKFLTNALNIDPENEYTKELIEEIKKDVKRSNLSNVISKHAGKTLSESMDSGKSDSSGSIFSKFASLLSTKVIKKTAAKAVSTGPAINNTVEATANAAPSQGGGDYLSMIRDAKNQLRK
jgi:tetratricopeptide (TPR) repeat protein